MIEHLSLKRCPFCGETAVLVKEPHATEGYYHFVKCSNCGANTGAHFGELGMFRAMSAWNRRKDV
jgi:Lar family restriction alleviation protein